MIQAAEAGHLLIRGNHRFQSATRARQRWWIAPNLHWTCVSTQGSPWFPPKVMGPSETFMGAFEGALSWDTLPARLRMFDSSGRPSGTPRRGFLLIAENRPRKQQNRVTWILGVPARSWQLLYSAWWFQLSWIFSILIPIYAKIVLGLKPPISVDLVQKAQNGPEFFTWFRGYLYAHKALFAALFSAKIFRPEVWRVGTCWNHVGLSENVGEKSTPSTGETWSSR